MSFTIGAKNYTVKLHHKNVQISALDQQITLEQLKLNLGSKYAILQFSEIPTESQKSVLAQNGIELLEYLPHYSFIVELKNVTTEKLEQLGIRGAIPFQVSYKYSKSLRNQENPSWALNGKFIDLVVSPHLNVSKAEFTSYLKLFGAQFLTEEHNDPFELIRMQKDRLAELTNTEIIKFIDYVPAPPEPEDQRARGLHRANMLDSKHPLGRKYDGSGVSIAIADDAQIGPHIDVQGRVTSFAVGTNGTHGDMTTGIAMGAGNINPDYRGMATGAYLYYYDIGGYPHISQAVSNLNNRGVVITSTSFSEGCNAGYTTTTRTVDQQTRQNPTLLHVFSAGNSSASTCGNNAYGAGTPWGTITGGRKQGKSTIATGNLFYNSALTTSSSRGPAADGRIKPDICANGTNQMSTDENNTYQVGGGTSAAAPSIAGLAAQMYHGYKSLNGGTNPESGLIKSAMLNTARDLGNKGPDFTYGWGRVNAHRAMLLIEEGRYLDSNISQNGFNTHSVSIPANTQELKFMLYWTDYEGSTSSSIALVNNLDLEVVTPNGDTIQPYVLNSAPSAAAITSPATRGIDNLNNVEQVEIDSVIAGVYTILINGKVIPQGPQKYFLSWERRSNDIEITYPSGGETFSTASSESIRWDAPLGSGTTTIEYSADSGATWTSIGSTTNTSFRLWDWIVPNIVTGNALVRVTNNGNVGVSANTFSIIGAPQNVRTEFICPDSVQLTWDTVPGAIGYEISQLGARYMDSIGISNTNSFTIYNLNLSNDNWFSVKAIGNGFKGKRANAILIGKNIDNCPFSYDIEVDRFQSPTNTYLVNCTNTKIPVTISVRNNGDSSAANIPLRMKLGSTVYTDTITGPIPGNTIQAFTFSDSLNFTTSGLTNLTVVSDFVLDQNELNDSIGLDINVLANSFTLPYTNDFESFNSCATSSDCGATICNLNGGWFNVVNGEGDVFDMRVNSGTTPSSGTGPSFDHNPGNTGGKYLYTEASGNTGACFNANSITISPCFDLTNTINPEFSFWYHMNGTSVGDLRVDVFANGVWTNNITNPIFGSQGNSWIKRTINMANYTGQVVNFRFTATTGNSWSSDIAIDDISFTDQSTSLPTNNLNSTYKIYPNPTAGQVTIEFNEIPESTLLIRDMNGRLINEKVILSRRTQFDLSGFAKGVYYISLKDNSVIEKLIVY